MNWVAYYKKDSEFCGFINMDTIRGIFISVDNRIMAELDSKVTVNLSDIYSRPLTIDDLNKFLQETQ